MLGLVAASGWNLLASELTQKQVTPQSSPTSHCFKACVQVILDSCFLSETFRYARFCLRPLRCHALPYFFDNRHCFFKNVVSDHLLHWETRQFFGSRRWLLIKWMNQSSTILSVFGSRMGIWHNSGAWGPLAKALSFQEVSKDKVLSIPFPSTGYLYEGVTPWGGFAYHEGASSNGKVDVLTGVGREKRTCVLNRIMNCWGNLLWDCANTELLILWKNTFSPPCLNLF